MKPAVLILVFISSITCFAQDDTLTIKNQKGVLVLSNYNYKYDYTGGEIRPLGFHDFFFPTDYFDKRLFLDTNKTITFKKGLRVEFLAGRFGLKQRAAVFKCIDSNKCYRYDKIYIIPVTISYKLYEDFEPFECRRNYYELTIINGSIVKFDYQHKAI